MYLDPRRNINPPPQPPKHRNDVQQPQTPQYQHNPRPYNPSYLSSSQDFVYKSPSQDENDSYIPNGKFQSYSQQTRTPSFPDISKKFDQKQLREPLTVKWTGVYDPQLFPKSEEVSRLENRNEEYKKNAILVVSDEDSLSLEGSEDSIIFDDDEISITNPGPKYSQSVFQDDKIKKTNKNSMTEKPKKDDEAKKDQINLIAKLAAAKLSSTSKAATPSEGNKILNDFRSRVSAATPGPKLSTEDTGLSTAASSISKRTSPKEDFPSLNSSDNSKPFSFEGKSFPQEKPSQPSQFINNILPTPKLDSKPLPPNNHNGTFSNDFSFQNKTVPPVPSSTFSIPNGQGHKQYPSYKPQNLPNGLDLSSRPTIDQNTKTSVNTIINIKSEPNAPNKVEFSIPNGVNIQDILEQARAIQQSQNNASNTSNTSNTTNGSFNYQYSLNNPVPNPTLNPNPNPNPMNNSNGFNYNNHKKKYSNYNDEDNFNNRNRYNNGYRDKNRDYNRDNNRDYNRDNNRDYNRDRNRNSFNNNSYQRNDNSRNYRNRESERSKTSLFIVKAEENSSDKAQIDSAKLLSTPLHDFKQKNYPSNNYLERGNTQEKHRKENKGQNQSGPLMERVRASSPSDAGGKDSPFSHMLKSFKEKSKELFQNIEIGLATLEQKIEMDLQEFMAVKFE